MNRLFLIASVLAATLASGCATATPATTATPVAQPAASATAAASTPAAAPTPPAVTYTPRKVGERFEVTGRLVLKGSMPMFVPVLTLFNGERWELKGVKKADAERLQNHKVVVEGTVDRPGTSTLQLPSMTVTYIALEK